MNILKTNEKLFVRIGILSASDSRSERNKQLFRNFVYLSTLGPFFPSFAFAYAISNFDDMQGAINSVGCGFTCIMSTIKYVLFMINKEHLVNILASYRKLADEGLYSCL